MAEGVLVTPSLPNRRRKLQHGSSRNLSDRKRVRSHSGCFQMSRERFAGGAAGPGIARPQVPFDSCQGGVERQAVDAGEIDAVKTAHSNIILLPLASGAADAPLLQYVRPALLKAEWPEEACSLPAPGAVIGDCCPESLKTVALQARRGAPQEVVNPALLPVIACLPVTGQRSTTSRNWNGRLRGEVDEGVGVDALRRSGPVLPPGRPPAKHWPSTLWDESRRCLPLATRPYAAVEPLRRDSRRLHHQYASGAALASLLLMISDRSGCRTSSTQESPGGHRAPDAYQSRWRQLRAVVTRLILQPRQISIVAARS
jgi:hypothetical protein